MAKSEAEHEEDEEDRQRLADRVLGMLEDAVYWGIALVLIIGSVALLIAQFNTMLRLRNAPVKTAMLEILDGLAAHLHLRRTALRRAGLPAVARDRRGAVLDRRHPGRHQGDRRAVRGGGDPARQGTAFARAVVEIGVLAGVVLALALAAFVLRERRRDTEDVGEQAAEEDAPTRSS